MQKKPSSQTKLLLVAFVLCFFNIQKLFSAEFVEVQEGSRTANDILEIPSFAINIRKDLENGEEIYQKIRSKVLGLRHFSDTYYDSKLAEDLKLKLYLNEVRDSFEAMRTSNVCFYPFGGVDVLNSAFGVSDAEITFATSSEPWGRISDLNENLISFVSYGSFNSIYNWWHAEDIALTAGTLGPLSLVSMIYGALTDNILNGDAESDVNVYAASFRLNADGTIKFLPTDSNEVYDNIAIWLQSENGKRKIWLNQRLIFSSKERVDSSKISSIHNFLRSSKSYGPIMMLEKAIPNKLFSYSDAQFLLNPPVDLQAIVSDCRLDNRFKAQDIFYRDWEQCFVKEIASGDFGYGKTIHIHAPPDGLHYAPVHYSDGFKMYIESFESAFEKREEEAFQHKSDIRKQELARRHRISIDKGEPESTLMKVGEEYLYLIAVYGPGRDGLITEPLMKEIPGVWKVKAAYALNYLYVPFSRLDDAFNILYKKMPRESGGLLELDFLNDEFFPNKRFVCKHVYLILNDEAKIRGEKIDSLVYEF